MKRPPIAHRTPSPQIISAVHSPDSGFILWELDSGGLWRERARSSDRHGHAAKFLDLSEWAAGALLEVFANPTQRGST